MLDLIKKHIEEDSLHHAYLIEGDPQKVSESIFNLLKDRSNNIQQDIFIKNYDNFYLEDSHEFIRHQSKKVSTSNSGGRFFILGINSITREAQNSLLKVVEEPPVGSHLFISVSQINKILPTLCSRCVILKDSQKIESVIDIKKFIESPVNKRLEMIDKIITHPDTDEEKTLKRKNIEIFLNGLEQKISEYSDKKNGAEQIFKARRYLNMTAPSYRLILENLALYI